MATQVKIIDGPSKGKLKIALFDGDIQNRHIVKFTLDDGLQLNILINGADREDGSGESWNITGNIHSRAVSKNAAMKASGESFEMYFSTQNRKGMITF